MDNAFARPIYVLSLIGTLIFCSLSLFWDTRTLSDRNKELIQKSFQINDDLNRLTEENKNLIATRDAGAKQTENYAGSIESLKKQNETLTFQLQKVQERLIKVFTWK